MAHRLEESPNVTHSLPAPEDGQVPPVSSPNATMVLVTVDNALVGAHNCMPKNPKGIHPVGPYVVNPKGTLNKMKARNLRKDIDELNERIDRIGERRTYFVV